MAFTMEVKKVSFCASEVCSFFHQLFSKRKKRKNCMIIGSHQFENNLILAPMAGISDRPFRQLCKDMGAAIAVSEMISANPTLRDTRKSKLRMDFDGETGLRWVQIAGSEPEVMAEAAKYNVEKGADIIDINMGCPVKKVCRKAAGSALLADEGLVEEICQAVVSAVDVPVTLKIRTGMEPANKNALAIAKIAERGGIAALTIHGRTRAEKFLGSAEHDTTREVRDKTDITLIANGDINSPEKAKSILEHTQADALMIGRAAQGRPWIFREIEHYLKSGIKQNPLSYAEILEIMLNHVRALHVFYGDWQGVKIARKHIGWYLKNHPAIQGTRKNFNQIRCPEEQLLVISSWFEKHQLAVAC